MNFPYSCAPDFPEFGGADFTTSELLLSIDSSLEQRIPFYCYCEECIAKIFIENRRSTTPSKISKIELTSSILFTMQDDAN